MWTDDLVTLMQEAGVGTLNVDIFVSTSAIPPILVSGAATVSIVETGGTAPLRTQNSVIRPAYIQPSAQIMTRARTPAMAKAKAQQAYDAVVGIRNSLVYRAPSPPFLLSGWYREINPLQEPFDLGLDDRKQARYVFNVIAIRRP